MNRVNVQLPNSFLSDSNNFYKRILLHCLNIVTGIEHIFDFDFQNIIFNFCFFYFLNKNK